LSNRHCFRNLLCTRTHCIITRQQSQQLSNHKLTNVILRLQAQVPKLEEQTERLTGPAKDCTNSSVPPSQSAKPNSGGLGNFLSHVRNPQLEKHDCW